MDLSEEEVSSDEATPEETSSEEESTESESEELEVENNIWRRMQEETIGRHHKQFEILMENYQRNGDSVEVANAKATNDLVPIFRKELREVLYEHLKWIHQLKKDPTFKKIMETKKNLIDDEGYDWEEATELAIHKRKFLLNK
ncbi:hypothetical protein AC249_AIPGENE2424, partial [Exaiptasia diaphana]